MGNIRKIVAGLVKEERTNFVGEGGNIFFDIDSGKLFLSDGVTSGGISLSGAVLPTGGAQDFVLKKLSATTGDYTWGNPTLDYPLTWDDYKSKFTSAAKGSGAPSLANIGNGHQLIQFSVGDSMFVEFHVLHSYAQGTPAFMHVHWLPGTTMAVDETVTWEFSYIIARCHHQGDSLTTARTTTTVTYTGDGTEIAGEHMISEMLTGVDLFEPDTQILLECKRIAGTYSGPIYGIQCDMHIQQNTFGTINKVPDFYN